MSKIILDCDLMKYPHSGLYYYCLNLGNYINKIQTERRMEHMGLYVPPHEADSFQQRKNSITEKKYHRFLKPFLWDCRVWHAPFQSGRIVPFTSKNIKVVLTVHDLNPLHEGKPVEEQQKSIAHTQQLIDRSSAIVCISEFCKQDVLANCEVGNKPVHVIYNGTNDLQEPELNGKSYKPNRPFLFTMGYVNRKKNMHVLLPLLEDNNIELIVAGRLDEPDYIESIKETATAKGIIDRLHILGPVSEGEKSWYLANCTAFMFPSLAEGFGSPVIEAMSFGKPVFLSTRTSLPEVGSDIAYYFQSFENDHMKAVFATGLSYFDKERAERATQRAKDFSWTKSAEAYLNVYQSLL